MRQRLWFAIGLASAVAIGAAGAAHAADVYVTQSPAPSTTVVVPSAPQTLAVGDIEANTVQAQTIYANKIKAAEVRGNVQQTKSVKIDHGKGDIKAPSVTASVIYADTIKANSVIADTIYVRDLERR